MQAVSYPLKAPGICVICEMTPTECSWIDTLREFEAATITKLSGRKYVCKHCVQTMADLLGFHTEEKFNEKSQALSAMSEDLATLTAEYDKLSNIAWDQLKSIVPKAGRKPKETK